jgi:hypothetical protein
MSVTQPLNVIIPTIGVETIVTPNTNFVRGGILIGSTTKLGHGLGRVSMGRNLTRSLRL